MAYAARYMRQPVIEVGGRNNCRLCRQTFPSFAELREHDQQFGHRFAIDSTEYQQLSSPEAGAQVLSIVMTMANGNNEVKLRVSAQQDSSPMVSIIGFCLRFIFCVDLSNDTLINLCDDCRMPRYLYSRKLFLSI